MSFIILTLYWTILVLEVSYEFPVTALIHRAFREWRECRKAIREARKMVGKKFLLQFNQSSRESDGAVPCVISYSVSRDSLLAFLGK